MTLAGVAAVIDPRRDIDIYLQRARELGVKIIASVETHIHADFVSGSHELKARMNVPRLDQYLAATNNLLK